MRREGHGGWRDDIFEENACFCDGIDVWGGYLFVAITAKIIGSAGVNADKEDVSDFWVF